MLRIDLHSHTTASDGLMSPAVLLARAARAGVTHLAVTDHDTVEGLLPAARAAVASGVTLVPGIEISATLNGREVHILGHNICPVFEPLLDWCKRRSVARRNRIERIVEQVNRMGVTITLAEVLAKSGGQTLARPHVARVLVDRGHARGVQDAFDRFLGRREVAGIPWSRPDAAEVITLIHEAGGTASLAHPGTNKISGAELRDLARSGLDAVEANHPDHDPSQVSLFTRRAEELGIAWTGGSDFHGTLPILTDLGGLTTARDQWDGLLTRAEWREASPQLRTARDQWASASRLEAMASEHPPEKVRS